MNEIINNWKQLIEEFTSKKFSKIADKSSTLAIHYYGNTDKEDYSFYLTNSYLQFQNYYTDFDVWLDYIFDMWLNEEGLTIAIKIGYKTSMFRILNTQVGK